VSIESRARSVAADLRLPEQETKLRRLSHPIDPLTAPLYVPRDDREHVTNAHCIATLTTRFNNAKGNWPEPT
jgi:hypothetical protein